MSRPTKHGDRISHLDPPRLDHLGVDAARPLLPVPPLCSKPKSIPAEPLLELAAPVVRLGSDLELRTSHSEPAARGQIGPRKIEIHKEIVTEEGKRLSVCDQLRHVDAHQGDLCI